MYVFRVLINDETSQAFHVVDKGIKYHQPEDYEWSDRNGSLHLKMAGSGHSGSLLFQEYEHGEQFSVSMGIHNYEPWCDVLCDLDSDITATKITASYYEPVGGHGRLWDQFKHYQTRSKHATAISIIISQSGDDLYDAKILIVRNHLEGRKLRAHMASMLNVSYDSVFDLSGHFKCLEPIGQGGSGSVLAADWSESSPISRLSMLLPPICVKFIYTFTPDDMKRFDRELAVWSTIEHKNLLPLIGFATAGSLNSCLISRRMPYGRLSDYLREPPSKAPIPILIAIADAVCFLHSSRIIHGDLKTANIAVDEIGDPKVYDFGLSRMLVDATEWKTSSIHPGGTTRWKAPEILNETVRVPNTKSDVYAFAMTCYEVIAREVPFYELRDYGIYSEVVEKKRTPEKPPSMEAQDPLWALLNECWAWDPQDRPEMDDVYKRISSLSLST